MHLENCENLNIVTHLLSNLQIYKVERKSDYVSLNLIQLLLGGCNMGLSIHRI